MHTRLSSLLLGLLLCGAANLTVCPSFGFARQTPRRLVEVPANQPISAARVYAHSYALLIGINDYAHLPKDLWLQYAVNDVEALKAVLVRSYGFEAANVTVLTDKQATKANIEHALAQLADKRRVKVEDRILIFFAGHGQTVKLPTGGEMGFLIPSDADIDLADAANAGPYLDTCLRMDTIWGYLESSPARHVLLLADACYSGLMTKLRSVETINPQTLAVWSARRALQVVTAGGQGETSSEDPKLGHGAFTFKLLEELKARAAEPGQVFTTTELFGALRTSVANLTGGRQTPQIGNYDTEGEFLFITAQPQTVPAVTPLPHRQAPPIPEISDLDTKAQISVTTDPPGVKVYLDGVEQVGVVTPATVEVDLGLDKTRQVEVGIQQEGYRPVVKSVQLHRGKHISIPSITLTPLPNVPTPLPGKSGQPGGGPGAQVKTKINPKDGAEMILIPAGDFLMGDDDRTDNPRRTVTLDGYYIYKNVVTVAMYRKFCSATGRPMPDTPSWGWKEDQPIVNVSWGDAKSYCDWAGVNLPTEAQWEKAARGTDGRMYPWGNEWDGSQCANSTVSSRGGTAPVGSYPAGASPYSVLDMAGNVWQWCADWYDANYYQNMPLRNPAGPASAPNGRRVVRGGAWDVNNPGDFRAANRSNGGPTFRLITIGFRGATGL